MLLHVVGSESLKDKIWILGKIFFFILETQFQFQILVLLLYVRDP